jgi:hypothetical protein
LCCYKTLYENFKCPYEMTKFSMADMWHSGLLPIVKKNHFTKTLWHHLGLFICINILVGRDIYVYIINLPISTQYIYREQKICMSMHSYMGLYKNFIWINRKRWSQSGMKKMNNLFCLRIVLSRSRRMALLSLFFMQTSWRLTVLHKNDENFK